jgi:hypothetical protein
MAAIARRHAGWDGYALRRAKALLNKIGIIEFHRLLDEHEQNA